MAENTNIEWCDHTFNPWTGCTKVSPGCANCYAEGWSKRSGIVTWGKGQPRRRTSEVKWREPLKWNRLALHFGQCPSCGFRGHAPDGCGKCGVELIPARPRVFCASLADWLDDEVPKEWQTDLLQLIAATPNLDWLLLTKRPENWEGVMTNALLDGVEMVHEWVNRRPPANVWIGTTVEDQQRADERIPALLEIPARVRFLSCEPLLGSVQLTSMRIDPTNALFLYWPLTGHHIAEGMNEPSLNDGAQRIHWVIAGGESGSNARPMHPDWARGLRDQCQAVGVPFLFKQWGEWEPYQQGNLSYMTSFKETRLLGNGPGATGWPMYRVGKKAAGRLLDGREWNQFPIL